MWAGFVAYLGALACAPRLGGGSSGRRSSRSSPPSPAPLAALPRRLQLRRLRPARGPARPRPLRPSARRGPSDPAFAHVTWIDATSAYGPLFTLATYPLAWLPVGVAVAALKATAALSVLGLAVLVARLAACPRRSPAARRRLRRPQPPGPHPRRRRRPQRRPGDAAGDARRRRRSLTAREASGRRRLRRRLRDQGPGGHRRPLRPARRRRSFADGGKRLNRPESARGRLLAGAGCAALAIGVAAYPAFGWHWLDAFGLAGENQHRTSHMSIPITFARLTGLDPDRGPRRGPRPLRRPLHLPPRSGPGAATTGSAPPPGHFGLLLATAWLLPWYLIWALPLVALSRDRPLQLLTLALTAYQLPARMPALAGAGPGWSGGASRSGAPARDPGREAAPTS